MGTIVVATDFSACSREAVKLAAALVRRKAALLFVVTAVEAPPLDVQVPMAPMGATGWELELLTAAEIELARLASQLRQSGINVETRAIIGTPTRFILEIAREVGAELIVLGTHGRKGAAHLFLGSVAEHVVRESACPVLVTREGTTIGPSWDDGRSFRLAIVADGSSASAAAFYWVRTSGQLFTGDISLLRPYWPPQEGAHYGIKDPWPGQRGDAELRSVLERDLRRDARALSGAHDPAIRLRIADADAPEALCQDTRELGADALVIGIPRHARSVTPVSATTILRAATVPVFCIPEAIRPSDRRCIAPVRSLLLPCDLSESSKAAIIPAYGLLSGGGRVELCYVHAHGRPDLLTGGADIPDLAHNEHAAIEADLRAVIPPEAAAHGVATHVSVIEATSVDEAILAAAERLDVDVIAVGSHGRSGLSRALIGSVAEQVARRSRRPVFIVHSRPDD